MRSIFFAFLITAIFFIAGCTKNACSNAEAAFPGTWVIADDAPGRQPADTLHFFRKNGKNVIAFYSAGSPGPNWPSQTETEYKFENGKLLYKDYSGTSADFFTVDSFEWVTAEKKFSVKLYQILLYMSADYRVTYQKVP